MNAPFIGKASVQCTVYTDYYDMSHVCVQLICLHDLQIMNCVTSPLELGDLMQLQSLQICPTFASFKFTEYDDTPDKVLYVLLHVRMLRCSLVPRHPRPPSERVSGSLTCHRGVSCERESVPLLYCL